MMFRSFCRVASLSVAMVLAQGAMAQSTSPAPAQPTDPTLKGPPVADHPVSPKVTTAAGFGPDSIEKKKAGGKKPTPPLSMKQFMTAIDSLSSSASPLTSDQSSKIQAISSDFETATKSYLDKNKAEIDSLRAQLSPADRETLDQQLARGGPLKVSKAGFGGKKHAKQNSQDSSTSPSSTTPSTTSSTTSTADSAAARTKLVEIYSNRPKADDAEAKILGVLTGDQRTLVEDKLKQMEQTRAEQHGGHKRPGSSSQPTK
jgi:hypothetical protein